MTRAVPLALLIVTGCAAGPGPSLLPRAVEQQSFDEPAVAPAPAVAPDPVLDQAIAELVARRIEARTEFEAADKAVAAQLAAGAKAAPGSDAWLDAQTAIGALDTARADVLNVATGLDALATARAAALQRPYPALESARAETDAELTRISGVLAARKTALPL